MKNQTIFEVAKAFFSKKGSEEERQEFEKLLDALEERGEAPTEADMSKSKSQVSERVFSSIRRKQNLRQLYQSGRRYAASMVVLAVLFATIYISITRNPTSPEWLTKSTAIGMRSTITLSDGTMVRLNENSRLEFPAFFASSSRTVHLYGEAYFDVTADPDKPFKVLSKQTEVTVLGTRFNVNTFQLPVVTVAEGSVKVADTLSKGNVLLSHGQQAVLYEGQIDVREVNPEFFIGWHTRKLQFDALPVEEVFGILERAYGVTIAFDGSSKKVNCLITGYYEGERIETIMKGLTNILDFTYETDVSTKTITLTIRHCKK